MILLDRPRFRNILRRESVGSFAPKSYARVFAEKFFMKDDTADSVLDNAKVKELVDQVANDDAFWRDFENDVENQIRAGTAVRQVKEVGKTCFVSDPDAPGIQGLSFS